MLFGLSKLEWPGRRIFTSASKKSSNFSLALFFPFSILVARFCEESTRLSREKEEAGEGALSEYPLHIRSSRPKPQERTWRSSRQCVSFKTQISMRKHKNHLAQLKSLSFRR
ncbi:unnamed protein product, partial [Nesidiocoris tenuis]